MTQCVNGHPITANARFCPQCGEPNPPPATAHQNPISTPAAPARTNGFAIASLILALLGITIPALICGYLGRRQIDQSQGTEQGRGLALAGIIIGWLQVAASIALVLVLVVVARNATDDTTTANNNPPAAETAEQTTVTGTPLAPLGLGGEQDPAVGALAPVVAGHGFDGAPIDIGGQSDTASLVVFMPHWCPHCQIELPQLVQWATDGTIPHDVRLVAVATSTDPAQNNYPPQDWFDRENWPGELLADSDDNKAATAYGVSSFPFFVAINTDGTVAERAAGELDQQRVGQIASRISTQ